jgi:hypothetical protein
MNELQLSIRIGALVLGGAILSLVLLRNRLGLLNSASWLVILGAVAIMPEHPQFALTFATQLGVEPDVAARVLTPHARVHFAPAGVYALIGLGLLCVVAHTLLRRGERAGWFAVLAALVLGTASEVLAGSVWFQHGAPWLPPTDGVVRGFGWEWLYLYPVAWLAALVIAYRPIFTRHARTAERVPPQRVGQRHAVQPGASA